MKVNKKIITIGTAILVILICFIVFYMFNNRSDIKSKISILDVSLDNARTDDVNYPIMYGINSEDLQKLYLKESGLRIIKIKLDAANISYFQTLYNINFEYSTANQNREIFIGNRLDINSVSNINIPPRKTRKNIIVSALVDSSNLSDKEILDKCKSIPIVMTANVGGEIQTISNATFIQK